ncbi:MAG: biotin/lipoyl-containing protein, partial [Woeseia sp.]
MSDNTDIIIPDLGDFADVEVIEVLVASGDKVAREDGLITLETDKATMDVPAPADGIIDSLTVSVGDRVSSGDKIGTMKGAGGEAAATPEASAADAAEESAPEQTAESSVDEPAADSAAGGEEQSVIVPDIGDFDAVEVIEVLVSVGDTVAKEDALITLETDKATMDVPSSLAGKVTAVHVAVGDKVSQGNKVIDVATSGGKQAAPASKPAAARQAAQAPATSEAPKRQEPPPAAAAPAAAAKELPPIDEAGFSQAHASPSVRKLARELGVDLAQVKGSGEKNRVLHDDVKAFVKKVLSGQGQAAASGGATSLPKVPVVDFAKFGEVDVQKLTRIQKISGPRLQASWINLPHVTQHDLADITELEERRQKLKGPAKERGISLTPLAFV